MLTRRFPGVFDGPIRGYGFKRVEQQRASSHTVRGHTRWNPVRTFYIHIMKILWVKGDGDRMCQGPVATLCEYALIARACLTQDQTRILGQPDHCK